MHLGQAQGCAGESRVNVPPSHVRHPGQRRPHTPPSQGRLWSPSVSGARSREAPPLSWTPWEVPVPLQHQGRKWQQLLLSPPPDLLAAGGGCGTAAGVTVVRVAQVTRLGWEPSHITGRATGPRMFTAPSLALPVPEPSLATHLEGGSGSHRPRCSQTPRNCCCPLGSGPSCCCWRMDPPPPALGRLEGPQGVGRAMPPAQPQGWARGAAVSCTGSPRATLPGSPPGLGPACPAASWASSNWAGMEPPLPRRLRRELVSSSRRPRTSTSWPGRQLLPRQRGRRGRSAPGKGGSFLPQALVPAAEPS